MNEVRATQVTIATSHVAPRVASDVVSTENDKTNALPSSGKELPIKEGQEAVFKTENVDIEQAVTEINEYVQLVQRDLHFSVDKDSGLTVVRVRDKESGELIRQIPEDIFLSLAQNLRENQTIRLFDVHG
ncbi:hypothetical protein AB835_03280 [Candidatus Endobugula sertula]|uniref:Flagellar biosynthesis protein FlaG n=1 Tax=Candidatus Endobugula sertula TaxID=62101 RepID=A0A1D2QSC2_9GAMM|nr:hypothetical protein AB835_03280 [Candidatus Endobugula sertula]